MNITAVVQLLSQVQLFATPQTAACQAPLSFTISWTLLIFMATESVIPSNHLILYCSLLLQPSILLSIRTFSKELSLSIRQPKYLSFSFIISPSDEYSGLIFIEIDQFDLSAVNEYGFPQNRAVYESNNTNIPPSTNYQCLYIKLQKNVIQEGQREIRLSWHVKCPVKPLKVSQVLIIQPCQAQSIIRDNTKTLFKHKCFYSANKNTSFLGIYQKIKRKKKLYSKS